VESKQQIDDDRIIVLGIQQMAATSRVFEFLKDEEDLYTLEDIKEFFNPQSGESS